MTAKAIVFFVLYFLLAANTAFANFAGGDGSATNPWQVATAAQLDAVRDDLAAHYILTADIDLTAATGLSSGAFWNGGAGWDPIGSTLGSSFTGSIDGNGFNILGLTINRSGDDQAGLFGWISFGAELTGLTLQAVDISGGSLAAALVVTNFGGTISDSLVTGSVSGDEFVGGLVARNLSGTIQESYFVGTVSGGIFSGTLVGSNWATIDNSTSSGSGQTGGGSGSGSGSSGGTSGGSGESGSSGSGSGGSGSSGSGSGGGSGSGSSGSGSSEGGSGGGGTPVVVTINSDPTGAVTISGTATRDETLTASNTLADADGLGAITYQWNADGAPINGASGNTYQLTQNEVGKTITVTASYTDDEGFDESVTSAATGAVADVNAVPTGGVTISGLPEVGQNLIADTSVLADADGLGPLTFQWSANGSPIDSASGNTYQLTQNELGKTITVTASYTDGKGTDESVTSNGTATVAPLPVPIVIDVNAAPTGVVSIGGTAIEGGTLTASNTLADADGLGPISYQWHASGLAIEGATGESYQLTQNEVGKAITVTASYTDGEGTDESKTSAATVAVANVNAVPSGYVTIIGMPSEDQILIADASVLADADGLGVINYQWNANGSPIDGASAISYKLTQNEVGKTITVTVSYTDDQGTDESITSSGTAPVTPEKNSLVIDDNVVPTGAVSIAGTAIKGETLTASNTLADADGLGAITYQWYANGTPIDGATGESYQLTQGEVDKTITVTASYTDGAGTVESVTSGATGAVASSNRSPTGYVIIIGTAEEGQTVTADASILADADGLGQFSYQWNLNGSPIALATGSTYQLTQNEIGKTLTVTVSYLDGGGIHESVTSGGLSAVANVNDTPSGTVSISGAAIQGATLTASNTLADADGLGAIAYQWNADGTPIAGATGITYQLTQSDVGKTITVTVSYTDGQGTDESMTSSGTAAVADVNNEPVGTVSITGTATQGETLTASNTLTDEDGLGAITYQWSADGTPIDGATGESFQLTQNEVGKIITATASYTDGQGGYESRISVATAAVADANFAPTGDVTIAGTAAEERTLTANTSNLADVDGLGEFSYQWHADGLAIAGATGNSYQLTRDEAGTVITVTVSYQDGDGVSQSVTSAGTAAVAYLEGSLIDGGSVTGEISGTESHPVVIRDAQVVAGASLSNALIDSGTVLDPAVQLGPNVTFTSAAAIPSFIDLTDALPSVTWNAGDGRTLPDLSADVLAADNGSLPLGIVDSIVVPGEFDPVTVGQSSGQGELTITIGEARATVLPHSVRQASPDAQPGLLYDEDGNMVLITATQREVSTLPVLADHGLFHGELHRHGLALQYSDSATMRVFDANEVHGSADYLSTRADFLSIPTAADQEGVYLRIIPELQGAFMYYMVFADENGTLMQQDLAPMPADWQALKNTFNATAGISDVSIDAQGMISMVVNGDTLRARMDYRVARSGNSDSGTSEEVDFISMGDMNGDGTEDFRVVYPEGDTQYFLILP